MFYNHFYKQEYLNSIENENVRRYAITLFKKSQPLEEQLGKDLYNFNTSEIEILLYAFNSAHINTLKTYVYYARKYTEYAIMKGKKISNINPFDGFPLKVLEKYVAKYKLKYVSYDDFKNLLKDVYNDYDKALFLSLFEGIGGNKYSELVNLTKKDLKKAEKVENGYIITLTSTENDGFKSTRELRISDELMKLLKSTAYSDEYYPANGNSKSMPYNEIPSGENVFRNVGSQKSNANITIDKQYIYRRMRLLKSITDGAIGGIGVLVGSGIIYDLSLSAEDDTLYSSDVAETMKRFDFHVNNISAISSYRNFLRKYKDGLEAIYGVKTVIN